MLLLPVVLWFTFVLLHENKVTVVAAINMYSHVVDYEYYYC